jgi:hypothetical protein
VVIDEDVAGGVDFLRVFVFENLGGEIRVNISLSSLGGSEAAKSKVKIQSSSPCHLMILTDRKKENVIPCPSNSTSQRLYRHRSRSYIHPLSNWSPSCISCFLSLPRRNGTPSLRNKSKYNDSIKLSIRDRDHHYQL